MKGFLKDGPAAGQAFEVGDPPLRRGVIVTGGAGFGEQADRYYLTAIDSSGAIYTHGGPVPWPPVAGPPVERTALPVGVAAAD
jgi:hypothetical protein